MYSQTQTFSDLLARDAGNLLFHNVKLLELNLHSSSPDLGMPSVGAWYFQDAERSNSRGWFRWQASLMGRVDKARLSH